jgi:hypothetical protein
LSAENPPRPTCFVIQCFDHGVYDRRYVETIKPALQRAGADAQRADEILGLNPVIEKIQRAIESAAICVAEVSTDNPNVWLELGYALALDRPTVILCDKSTRERLPFDIQHRPVIYYRTDSKSGFDDLERDVVREVSNQLAIEQRAQRSLTLKPGGSVTTDLHDYEVAILTFAFACWPTTVGGASQWDLARRMRAAGFNEIALALGITGLLKRKFIVQRTLEELNDDGSRAEVNYYQVTPEGVDWIGANRAILELRVPDARPRPTAPPISKSATEEDIPF